MSKADTSVLEKIHNLIAQDMLKRLEQGDCEAKDWAVIVKFLKDNNIDALPQDDADAEDGFQALVRRAQERVAAGA